MTFTRLALLALVAAFVVGAEYLARWNESAAAVSQWPTLGAAPTGATTHAIEPRAEPTPIRLDLAYLWRNEPGAKKTLALNPRRFGEAATWTLAVNSEGFRGREREADDSREDAYRILCVGDSITFGFNVTQGVAYPDRIAYRLDSLHPERRFEVINAAVPGWSWNQGARYVLEEGLALRPDVVVAAHGTADQLMPARITDRERMWLRDRTPIGALERVRAIATRTALGRILLSRRSLTDATISPDCESQRYRFGVCRRASPLEIEESVRTLDERVRVPGVDLIVVNLDFSETDSVRAVRHATSGTDVRFVDYVAEQKAALLRRQIEESGRLDLAWPHVPFVLSSAIGPPPAKGRGARVTFRLRDSRKASVYRVVGRGEDADGFEFDSPLFDDATRGDERADDGVYSATIEVPPLTTVVRYQYVVGETPEFEALPPLQSSWSPRRIRLNRDSIASIEQFGALPLMVDDLHPNARGHDAIAQRLVEEIEQLPSFQRFTEVSVAE